MNFFVLFLSKTFLYCFYVKHLTASNPKRLWCNGSNPCHVDFDFMLNQMNSKYTPCIVVYIIIFVCFLYKGVWEGVSYTFWYILLRIQQHMCFATNNKNVKVKKCVNASTIILFQISELFLYYKAFHYKVASCLKNI